MAKEYTNFEDLDEFEQKWFLKDTWCDKCSKKGLGIEDPVMYKKNGITFIKGKCVICGEPQISQIVTKEVKD